MGTTLQMLRVLTHKLVYEPHRHASSDERKDRAYDLVEDFSLTFRIHGAVASICSIRESTVVRVTSGELSRNGTVVDGCIAAADSRLSHIQQNSAIPNPVSIPRRHIGSSLSVVTPAFYHRLYVRRSNLMRRPYGSRLRCNRNTNRHNRYTR
jgi:hypothetical protein